MTLNVTQFGNMSTQYNVTHETIKDVKSRDGNKFHKLTLASFDSDDLANVTYDHQSHNSWTRDAGIRVNFLKSNREGEGHGKRIMQHLYDRYPKSPIDWGSTIKPASTHMAKQFQSKYPDRTSFEPVDTGDY